MRAHQDWISWSEDEALAQLPAVSPWVTARVAAKGWLDEEEILSQLPALAGFKDARAC